MNHSRDLREARQRCDSYGHDMKRKDSQIRDLQQRLESTEGCKSKKLSKISFNWFYRLVYEALYNLIF